MRFTMPFRVALAAVLVLSVTMVAQSPNVKQEIIKVEDTLLNSGKARNAAGWTSVSGESWVMIGADGQVLTFEQRQAQFKAGTFAGPDQATPPYYKRPGYSVRFLGETAAVTMWNGEPSATEPGGSIQTRVWVKHEGRWKQVMGQVTRVTKK